MRLGGETITIPGGEGHTHCPMRNNTFLVLGAPTTLEPGPDRIKALEGFLIGETTRGGIVGANRSVS